MIIYIDRIGIFRSTDSSAGTILYTGISGGIMKKTVLILILIAVASAAYASVEKRAQWWKIRAEALTKERDELVNRGISSTVIDLLNRDIARASELAKNNIPETDAASMPTIRNVAEKTVPAAYGAWTIRFLGDKNSQQTVSSALTVAIRNKVRALYLDKEIEADDKYIDSVVKAAIDADEKSFAVFECTLLSLAANNDGLTKNAVDAVTSSASARYAETAAGEPDLRAAVAASADEYFRTFNFPRALSASTFLTESTTWRKVQRACARDAQRLAAASEFAPSVRSVKDAAKISALCAHRQEFEKAAFGKLYSAYIDTTPFPKNSGETLPKEPDMPALFAEIDEARSSALKDAKSTSDDIIVKAEARMKESISRQMKPCADAFFRQEEKMKILSGEDASPDTVQTSVSGAKKVFLEKVRKANAYKSASLRCLTLFLAKDKDTSGKELLALYQCRIEADKKYFSIINALDAKAAAASPDMGEARRIYTGLHAQERALFDIINATAVIKTGERQGMDQGQIADAMKIKEDFGRSYADALSENASRRAKASLAAPQISRNERERSGREEETFAQSELASINDSLGSWSYAYTAAQKSAAAFESYALLYRRLSEDARSGQMTDALQRVVKEETLIPMVDGFNAAQIKNETTQRNYIRKSVQRDTAMLKTLTDFYTRRKISCSKIHSAADLRVIEQQMQHRPSIIIDQWTMTDTNFTEIDRKAAKALANQCKRNAWIGKKNTGLVPDTATTIAKAGISLSIPDGFDEKKPGDKEDPSFVKRYSSMDSLSTISIAVVPLSGRTDREAAEEWMGKLGLKTVRSSTGKNAAGNFYWSVSRDEHRNVTELRAQSHGDQLVIISGETSKERYPFFKERLNAVFCSAK